MFLRDLRFFCKNKYCNSPQKKAQINFGKIWSFTWSMIPLCIRVEKPFKVDTAVHCRTGGWELKYIIENSIYCVEKMIQFHNNNMYAVSNLLTAYILYLLWIIIYDRKIRIFANPHSVASYAMLIMLIQRRKTITKLICKTNLVALHWIRPVWSFDSEVAL